MYRPTRIRVQESPSPSLQYWTCSRLETRVWRLVRTPDFSSVSCTRRSTKLNWSGASPCVLESICSGLKETKMVRARNKIKRTTSRDHRPSGSSTVQGGRRRGRQRKRWTNNIAEWTGKCFAETRANAHERHRWRYYRWCRRSSAQRPYDPGGWRDLWRDIYWKSRKETERTIIDWLLAFH